MNGNVVIKQSLYLINPDSVKVLVSTNNENKKRIRLCFVYKKVTYNLATTDPIVWRKFLNKDAGEYQFNEPKFLCISLGEKFSDGFCYKLVAAIL